MTSEQSLYSWYELLRFSDLSKLVRWKEVTAQFALSVGPSDAFDFLRLHLGGCPREPSQINKLQQAILDVDDSLPLQDNSFALNILVTDLLCEVLSKASQTADLTALAIISSRGMRIDDFAPSSVLLDTAITYALKRGQSIRVIDEINIDERQPKLNQLLKQMQDMVKSATASPPTEAVLNDLITKYKNETQAVREHVADTQRQLSGLYQSSRILREENAFLKLLLRAAVPIHDRKAAAAEAVDVGLSIAQAGMLTMIHPYSYAIIRKLVASNDMEQATLIPASDIVGYSREELLDEIGSSDSLEAVSDLCPMLSAISKFRTSDIANGRNNLLSATLAIIQSPIHPAALAFRICIEAYLVRTLGLYDGS